MSAPCHQCIKGTIHTGQPIGQIRPLHGLNTYITGNESNPRAIIVMYSDIFGHNLPNNKLIADAYAKSGEYLVYVPDFFQGDPVGLKMADVLLPVDAAKQSTLSKYTGLLACAPSFAMWMTRHGHGKTDKVCMEFLGSLRRATPTTTKIGMVGMCWGGRYAIRAGLESNMISVNGNRTSLIDAVVALHPSHLDIPLDVEKLVVPTSFGWGQEDSLVTIETKAKVEEIHARSRKAGAADMPEMQHKVYSPGRHGFSVRGNPDDPLERKCLEDSITQVLNWFQLHQ